MLVSNDLGVMTRDLQLPFIIPARGAAGEGRAKEKWDQGALKKRNGADHGADRSRDRIIMDISLLSSLRIVSVLSVLLGLALVAIVTTL